MGSVTQIDCEVAVVGGGPAGMAAAVTASGAGRRVALFDDNPAPGGQIWRRGAGAAQSGVASYWFERLQSAGVPVFSDARVLHAEGASLDVETEDTFLKVASRKLVLATGARELFLPFPGWTLPNVIGVGGLQALVKSGLPIEGKRVVVAGTGPLLLAVAAYLSKHGARVLFICEQASLSALAKFGLGMMRFPGKLVEAVQLRFASRMAEYWMESWPVAARGQNRLETVTISKKGRTREVECDYLACGFHLVPNTELPQLLRCRLKDGFVEVDEYQRTSQADVYCAGEPTGIGGMELAIVEGRIAGSAATGLENQAQRLFAERARYRKLAEAMKRAFQLRPELAQVPKPETLLCRCEDVPFGRTQKFNSWKAAKLHTRCGMGPCQGRVCGAAAAFLFGWNVESVRPPVFPGRCGSLAEISAMAATSDANGGSR